MVAPIRGAAATPIRWLPRSGPRPGQAQPAPPKAGPWPQARAGASPISSAPAGRTIAPTRRGTQLRRSRWCCRGRSCAAASMASALLSEGSLHAAEPGAGLRVLAPHGEGDRCLSFQFDARAVRPAGPRCRRSRAAFARQPPAAAARTGSADGAGPRGHGRARCARGGRRRARGGGRRHRRPRAPGAVGGAAPSRPHARVLRLLESDSTGPHTLAELAAAPA